MTKLVLRNVCRTFGNVTAVDNFNLTVEDGELVSLLGPSGCGKTTTLRMIAGFMPPTSGTIEVDGQVVSSAAWTLAPEKRQMSMIFQSYAIWPNMTVAENVGFGLKVRKLKDDEIRTRVDEILGVVQLGALRDRYPAELSGGQQQRVALARSIVVNPAVLLLDEPLSNLDANLREEMRFEIRRLHDEFKIAMVYVTHDQAEAMVTSDRIVVMNKGRAEQIDAPFALYGRPQTRFVAGFIGRTNFLEGKLNGDAVQFGGFSVPKHVLHTAGGLPQDVLVSLRPQSVHLHRQNPGEVAGSCCVQGSVQRRAYLGEYWDYHVSLPGAAQPLRVTARAQDVFEVNASVWAAIDTTQLTVIRRE
jgi:ABC-type Fe3+/spermidine/putrescine transport system ATPase subunit